MVGSPVKNSHSNLSSLLPFVQPKGWQMQQWQALLKLGWPRKSHEEWKYTSLELEGASTFGPAANQCIDNLSYESLSLGLESYRLVFFDGHYSVRLSDWVPKVTITPLPVLGEDRNTSLSSAIRPDAMSMLTDATATTGVLIEVEPGAVLDKPIYLYHLNSGGRQELCSHRHHVTLGNSAQVQLIEHHVSLDQGGGVSLARLTTQLESNAQLHHTKIIEESQQQHHFGHNDFSLKRDASASSTTFMFGGQSIRHTSSASLTGENGHIEMNSLSLPNQQHVFDSRTYLEHLAPHCQSQQLHKVVAADQSHGVFDGMIYVDNEAQKTDGQMDNHSLILGDLAKVNAKPQLEIYADDVKCSHGATTGQLNKDQIDYLRARGIKKRVAEQMIVEAFATEVCDKIQHSSVKAYCTEAIGTHLKGIK